MNSTQRLIKNIATGFATALAVLIIGSIVGGALSVLSLLSSSSGEIQSYTLPFDGVNSLSIDSNIYSVTIKEGTEFKVVATNVSEHYISELDSDGTLKLYYEGFQFHWLGSFINGSTKGSIIVYLPSNFIADQVHINAGIANLTIEHLYTNRLDLDASTGNINGSDIQAKETDIDASVGNIKFKNVILTDAEIACSVGNVTINGELLGNSSIDASVGNINLILNARADDYNLDAETSLGTLKIDGTKYTDPKWNNSTATNYLELDGSVGDINIEFAQ